MLVPFFCDTHRSSSPSPLHSPSHIYSVQSSVPLVLFCAEYSDHGFLFILCFSVSRENKVSVIHRPTYIHFLSLIYPIPLVSIKVFKIDHQRSSEDRRSLQYHSLLSTVGISFDTGGYRIHGCRHSNEQLFVAHDLCAIHGEEVCLVL